MGRSGDSRLFSIDFAEAEDRLDPGDLALRRDDLAGGFQAFGLALEPESEQIRLRLFQEQVELVVGLLSKFSGLAHDIFLRDPIGSSQ
jgi:hypothetical protein